MTYLVFMSAESLLLYDNNPYFILLIHWRNQAIYPVGIPHSGFVCSSVVFSLASLILVK